MSCAVNDTKPGSESHTMRMRSVMYERIREQVVKRGHCHVSPDEVLKHWNNDYIAKTSIQKKLRTMLVMVTVSRTRYGGVVIRKNAEEAYVPPKRARRAEQLLTKIQTSCVSNGRCVIRKSCWSRYWSTLANAMDAIDRRRAARFTDFTVDADGDSIVVAHKRRTVG